MNANMEETIGIPYERMATVGEWTDGPHEQGNGTGNGRGAEEGEARGLNVNGKEKTGTGKPNGSGNGHPPSPPHVDWEDDGYASDNYEPEHEYEHHEPTYAHEPQRPPPAAVRSPPTNGAAHRERKGSRTRGSSDDAPAVIDDGLFKITGKGHISSSSASTRYRPPDSRRHPSDRRRRRDSHRTAERHAHNGGIGAGGVNGRPNVEEDLEKGWRKEDLTRKPSNVAVLLPEYRYCRRCSIVRPPRAHHCRACGTVSRLFFSPCISCRWRAVSFTV